MLVYDQTTSIKMIEIQQQIPNPAPRVKSTRYNKADLDIQS